MRSAKTILEKYKRIEESSREPKGLPYYFMEVRVSNNGYSKIDAFDKKLVGTKDYMGIAYFWGQKYKYYLRDCSIDDRVKIHDQFVDAGLELAGDSPEHDEIVKTVLKLKEV